MKKGLFAAAVMVTSTLASTSAYAGATLYTDKAAFLNDFNYVKHADFTTLPLENRITNTANTDNWEDNTFLLDSNGNNPFKKANGEPALWGSNITGAATVWFGDLYNTVGFSVTALTDWDSPFLTLGGYPLPGSGIPGSSYEFHVFDSIKAGDSLFFGATDSLGFNTTLASIYNLGHLDGRSATFTMDSVFYGNIGDAPSAVPIPAAAFMFSTALLGFLGLRRKAKLTQF